ncbi:zinc-binding dehydrogenase [Drepanopeziza brunnea f. sp. 'multigermtubi' MB_m1]|uniref:Zinc-binding dehydrogenase n=1 Tax=Marssonina brunnea f. sp. multigermtubi (strain MB_m1) TaxID=1072389 RepID=K1X4T1_MARBU|nr:zinc-binding dehydrogenase [Drepanopeziza brunnea f. sp. 'multigermtubi' MB_m1]EKD20092.1 zinc-binding dehydrogenase [Drepanopeziza brunnea f. sp. 'multigermtubi' MB_m1]
MPKAIVMKHIEGKPGKVYYPLQIKEVPAPAPGPNDLTIQIHAAALNHRDFFLRQALYPAPSFDVPLLADGCGIVKSVGSSASPSLEGKRVILTPGRGWKDSPDGPEAPSGYQILGGTTTIPIGTLQEFVTVCEDEVELAPAHLSAVEAAALPLTGLTGWRAYVSKSGNAQPGRNILVTGIGGGVALNVLQFVVAMGGNAYVTSGSQEKIDRAVSMGAKGGVGYKTEGWEKGLKAQLPKDRPYIDAIIDGAGGDVIAKAVKLLKAGGIVVQYGMTTAPKMEWTMNAVLKNIDLKGSTMGSRKEFRDMVAFVNEKKIRPVVSRSVKGIDNLQDIDGLFEDMRIGSQFGKLVIELVPEEGSAIFSVS